MKVFVAGATGVIGGVLIPFLVKEGHEVFGMTHNKASKSIIQGIGAAPLVANVFEGDEVMDVFREVRPEVDIHQLTSLNNYNLGDNARIRSVGTRNLVDASQTVGVKRMIAQSISWAYEPGKYPATEDIPLDINAPEPRKTTIDGVAALETVWLPFYASLIGAVEPKVQAGNNRGERGASNAKARQDYGWEPVFPNWHDGFRACLSASNDINNI